MYLKDLINIIKEKIKALNQAQEKEPPKNGERVFGRLKNLVHGHLQYSFQTGIEDCG